MSDTTVVIEKAPKPGDYAWLVMAAGIFLYDMFAIKSKKCETMSSAIWRSLHHPVKGPTAVLAWLTVTHHLFANKRARTVYTTHITKVKSRRIPSES